MEVLENKVYWEIGRWYQVPKEEINRIWKLMLNHPDKIASDTWGAYVDSPLIATKGEKIKLFDYDSGDTLFIEIDDYFSFGKEDIAQWKWEILYGGVLTGINNRTNNLGYVEAGQPPYIIKKQSRPEPIAHAINASHFDEETQPGLFSSSGTWGESFANKGITYMQQSDLKHYFRPIGFTIKIL